MPSARDALLDTRIRHLPPHAWLDVFHGEHRGADLEVRFEISKLAEKHGDLTLGELVRKLRSKRTRKPPTRISFVSMNRNNDQESWCVYP